MLQVLEKYFAIWREGHNGWKNTSTVENHVADYRERFFEPGTARHNPFNAENFPYHIYSGYLAPSFFYSSFSSFPSTTFPTIAQPIWRRERKGSSLIELFLFPCTLSRSPFIFKSPLLCRPIALRLNGSFCFCFFRFIYARLLKNFTLTFMLGRNLRRGGWNFLRKLCGAYWSRFYRIFHGYLVISIINVPINLLLLVI